MCRFGKIREVTLGSYSVPQELLHLAAIDGAPPLRTLRSVVLPISRPISRPILAVVSIFALVAVWKDFLWPLLVEYGYNRAAPRLLAT
jgi:ABC-type glycerol-3-phosphate transport system permease component